MSCASGLSRQLNMLIFGVAIVQRVKPPDKASYRFRLDTKRVRWPMSALGQKQTFAMQNVMSALNPKSGHVQRTSRCPLCAKSRHAQRN